MGCITKQDGVLSCSHPRVKKIHEWGGGAAHPTKSTWFRFITVEFLDGGQETFRDNGENDTAINEAEEYLKSLN